MRLFWHSFDLAVSRFSGKRAERRPGVDPVTAEAYSPRGHQLRLLGEVEPTASPPTTPTPHEPVDLPTQALLPRQAEWIAQGNGSLADRHDDVRAQPTPKAFLLEFLRSALRSERVPRRLGPWPTRPRTGARPQPTQSFVATGRRDRGEPSWPTRDVGCAGRAIGVDGRPRPRRPWIVVPSQKRSRPCGDAVQLDRLPSSAPGRPQRSITQQQQLIARQAPETQ